MASATKVTTPFPVFSQLHSVEAVSQTELALVLSLRARLKQLETQLTVAEVSIQTRLEAGAEVEHGDRSVELRESFRKSVSWKSVAERLATRLRLDGYCDRVLSRTRPTRSVTLQID